MCKALPQTSVGWRRRAYVHGTLTLQIFVKGENSSPEEQFDLRKPKK